MSGITLMGEPKKLPQSLTGKYSLIILNFKKDLSTKALAWRQLFQKNLSSIQDLKFYNICIFGEDDPLTRIWINHSIRYEVPKLTARNTFIITYINQENFLKMMDMNKNSIYLVLLDRHAKILMLEKKKNNNHLNLISEIRKNTPALLR